MGAWLGKQACCGRSAERERGQDLRETLREAQEDAWELREKLRKQREKAAKEKKDMLMIFECDKGCYEAQIAALSESLTMNGGSTASKPNKTNA